MSWHLLHGDCRELMGDMEGCSIDAIVTDPPYGLSREPDAAEVLMHWLAGDDYQHRGNGFMGNSWDSFVPGPATWREALRVLKPGGFLLAFFSTRTYDLGTIAIRLAGFEVRDMVDWLFGSGFPKGGLVDGRGSCLKPGHEPIVMARKPCIGSTRANVAAFGTGKLSIDACRIGETGARNNGRQAGTNGIYGHIGATTPVDYGKGRWPANVIHDGSDEVVALFPTAPGQLADAKLTGERKTGRVYGEMGYPRQGEASAGSDNEGAVGFSMRPGARRLDSGSAARFFYCAKASKTDRDEGLDQFAPQAFVQFQTGNGESGAASSLSEGRSTEYRNVHPTVKPEALMRYLVRLVTPEGGTVLDPFTGSGSTGKAAVLEGYSFIGCELTAEYLPIAEARMAAAVQRATAEQARLDVRQADLFGGEAAA